MQPLIYLSLLLLFLVVASLPAVYHRLRRFMIRRRIICPLSKRPVNVRFVCRSARSRLFPVGVKSCDAFENPEDIRCAESCVKLLGTSGLSPRYRREKKLSPRGLRCRTQRA